MKYPDTILLRVPAGVSARIDARASNRSAFIRAAIEAALDALDWHAAFIEASGTSRNTLLDDLPMKAATGSVYRFEFPLGDV